MSKKAIYYDEARRLYIQQGLGLTAIEGMLNEQISRRQLHNWKTDGDWDSKRRRYIEENENLQEMVMQIAKTAAKNALEKPTPKNLLALTRAIAALNQKDALAMFSPPEEKKEEDAPSLTRALEALTKHLEG